MFYKNCALVALVIFVAGCGLETRTYVMTKDRVGLDRGNGNGGCITGTCPSPPPPAETTRKVYVLEITRPVPESQVQKIEQTAINAITEPSAVETPPVSPTAPAENAEASQENAPAQEAAPAEQPSVSSPSTASAGQNGGNVQAATYTVQKDDTLQKISKKVYGTYSKWYKIYKANKDKIKNPNVLLPGTVLTIPALK